MLLQGAQIGAGGWTPGPPHFNHWLCKRPSESTMSIVGLSPRLCRLQVQQNIFHYEDALAYLLFGQGPSPFDPRNPAFLRRPWIQGQPWKVFKFHKSENVLELFWKTSGSSWNVWNLPMWNFQQDLVTWWLWELPVIVAIKRVEELLRPLIINKRHARMLQIGVFFSLKYQ